MTNRTQHAAAPATMLQDNGSDDQPRLGARRAALVARADKPAPLWEAVPGDGRGIPSTSEVLHANPTPQLRPILEDKIIATLQCPLNPDETYRAGNDRRECEIAAIFGELTALESLAMRRRLDADRSDDRLVVELRRINIERRQRLRQFLDRPRRGAMR